MNETTTVHVPGRRGSIRIVHRGQERRFRVRAGAVQVPTEFVGVFMWAVPGAALPSEGTAGDLVTTDAATGEQENPNE